MNNQQLLLIIAGMFLATYPIRFVPLLWFNRIEVPPVLKRWLSFVPVAIFASLVTQILFEPIGLADKAIDWREQFPLLVSCIATLGITIKTRSIGWGMGLGFSCYVLLTYFFS